MGREQGDAQPSLRLTGVHAGWERRSPVLNGLDLDVQGPGTFVVEGRNGSGKSTLVEVISGYLRPWEGEVWIAGAPATSEKARLHRRVCRATPSLFAPMSVRDHITFAARSRAVGIESQLVRAERLGLSPWLDESAGVLSTGNARKLWYLINCMGDAAVVVLDEPFSGLDEESLRVMLEEIVTISGQALVLLVTHILPDGLEPMERWRLDRGSQPDCEQVV